ncbi:MAG: D-glycero-beta-D-manno-heptose 1,7-bisphosphate 7-phosphatase [Pseudomonadota bacterium]
MQPALFLDRDGVININHGYVSDIDSFDFIPGIFNIVEQAIAQGFKVIVVTNQSGIGRGYYTEDQFLQVTHWMRGEFSKHGGRIDGVYFCPHHPSEAKGQYLQVCCCRKPKPGLFEDAIKTHQIAVDKSIMIGDKKSDLVAAASAGVKNRILFSQDTQQSSEYQTLWLQQTDFNGVDLSMLIEHIA